MIYTLIDTDRVKNLRYFLRLCKINFLKKLNPLTICTLPGRWACQEKSVCFNDLQRQAGQSVVIFLKIATFAPYEQKNETGCGGSFRRGR